MVFHNISYPFKKIALIFFITFIFNDLPARQHQDTTISRLLADSTLKSSPDSEEEASFSNAGFSSTKEQRTRRSVPVETINALKKQKAFEYANDPAYWKKRKPAYDNDLNFFLAFAGIARLLIWLVIIGMVIYAFYIVVIKNKFYLFYSSSSPKAHKTDISEVEDINLDDKIRDAAGSKDYRVAVRYMYLKALKLLNEKGLIKYTAQGSNAAYVTAVSGQPAGEQFRYLTRSYEYVWYGEFSLNEERFGYIHQKFEVFYQSLNISGNYIKPIH